MRVVSLVPSATETLVAWGIPPVACTRFCEQPGLPVVGGTKTPDLEAIAALGPDVVVMDEEENRREDADALAAAGLALHVTAVRSVADVAPSLARLAAAVGVGFEPELLEAAGHEPERSRLRAFVPVWRRPYVTVNAETYGSSLLAALGVDNVFGAHPDRYPRLDLDEAAAARPHVVLAPSEPYPFGARHVAELARVAPVVLVDGKDLFWWGVRTPGAVGRLRRTLAGGEPSAGG